MTTNPLTLPEVAAGVLPAGLLQRPWAVIASTISPQVIGSPASARIRSAAAIWLSFSAGAGCGSGFFFGAAFFFAGAFFVAIVVLSHRVAVVAGRR